MDKLDTMSESIRELYELRKAKGLVPYDVRGYLGVAPGIDAPLSIVDQLIRRRRTDSAIEDNTDLLADMSAAAMERRRRLVDEGMLLTSLQLCERLDISPHSLSAAVHDRRIFWIDGPTGERLYPSFFATDVAPQSDIERICVELGDVPGSVKWQFFSMPKHSLDGATPIDALAHGQFDRVLRTARLSMENNRTPGQVFDVENFMGEVDGEEL